MPIYIFTIISLVEFISSVAIWSIVSAFRKQMYRDRVFDFRVKMETLDGLLMI